MNTLDDLRRTLDHHAGDVHDDVVHSRTAAVRGRAVAVRRRRAAGVATAAALAVVGALVAPQLVTDTDPQLADRTLIGQVAPASMQSLGYTYRFAEGVAQRDGNATVRLRASDQPRLISWASDAPRVTVTTTVEGQESESGATDFDDFTLVYPQESGRWTVRAGGGDTAIAVYELVEEATPPGTTTFDGSFFRQEVGSQQLLAVESLDPGSDVLTVSTTVPETERMWVAEFCRGVPAAGRLWVNTSVNGEGATASGGCDEDAFDPATGSGTWLDDRHLPEPGERVVVRMWVSRGVDGDPIAYDGAQLALGLYEIAEPAATVGGNAMERLVEYEGHTWVYVDSRERGAGATRVAVTNEDVSPRLAIGAYSRAGGIVTMRGPDSGSFRSSAALGGSSTLGVLAPGQTATATTRDPLGPRGSMGIALYERID